MKSSLVDAAEKLANRYRDGQPTATPTGTPPITTQEPMAQVAATRAIFCPSRPRRGVSSGVSSSLASMYELPRVTSQQLANPASSGSNQSSREEALHSMLRCTMDMENSASGAVANLPESCI